MKENSSTVHFFQVKIISCNFTKNKKIISPERNYVKVPMYVGFGSLESPERQLKKIKNKTGNQKNLDLFKYIKKISNISSCVQ